MKGAEGLIEQDISGSPQTAHPFDGVLESIWQEKVHLPAAVFSTFGSGNRMLNTLKS